MKKLISCLVLSAMLCSLAACGGKASTENNSAGNTTAAENAAGDNKIVVPGEPAEGQAQDGEAAVSPQSDLEPPQVANAGDAYLAIVDSTWKRQYWGGDDISKNNLAYNAGVAHITGNGDYTVSVTTDSKGYRFATTGNKDDASDVPTGLSFMAVMLRDGETMYPGAVITVNSVKVNGNEIPMLTKAYTSSDDGKETRANIFNEWVSKPAADGRCVDGPLYTDASAETLQPYGSEYGAQIIDKAAFDGGWTSVEVNFTVSGIAG